MNPSNGRVALITGSAQGIGRAIAIRLAEDGYDVALNDIASQKETLEDLKKQLVQDLGRKVIVVVADVSSEEEVKGMVESVVESLGALDVMIANAGIGLFKPLFEHTAEQWDKVFSINARGTFLCYKYAGLQMVKQKRSDSRIVGASSSAGKQGSAMSSAYSSTKFAVRGLTQAAAAELGPYGITVNAYAPGVTETPGVLASFAAGGHDTALEGVIQRTALKKIGKSEDVASLVSYIVSKEAHYITGQSLSVNGGSFYD